MCFLYGVCRCIVFSLQLLTAVSAGRLGYTLLEFISTKLNSTKYNLHWDTPLQVQVYWREYAVGEIQLCNGCKLATIHALCRWIAFPPSGAVRYGAVRCGGSERESLVMADISTADSTLKVGRGLNRIAIAVAAT